MVVNKDVTMRLFLEEEKATHSSILAWKIPRTEEPNRLPSMGSQRNGHDSTRMQTCYLLQHCLKQMYICVYAQGKSGKMYSKALTVGTSA